MNKGNETWKWGLVFVLLAVFLVTANQSYVHISSLEDFEPPDDYRMGDSWDLEQQRGPGTSQPMERPLPETQDSSAPVGADSSQGDPVIRIREDVDWGELDNSANTDFEDDADVADDADDAGDAVGAVEAIAHEDFLVLPGELILDESD